MKQITSILFFLLLYQVIHAQYYARGIVTDESGVPLYNVKIQLFSKVPSVFYSGATGEFGIPSLLSSDTIYIKAEGYEDYQKFIPLNVYHVISLKSLPGSRSIVKNKLVSYAFNKVGSNKEMQISPGESYSKLVENQFVKTSEFPESAFTLHIDRASYSNIRRILNMDMTVPPDAVRIDEILNYFNFNQDTNSLNGFLLKSFQTSCPWNKNTSLLLLQLQAPKIDLSHLPAANLVFLIDVSGSMDQPKRLPLLQQSLKLLVANLRSIDSVSIVVYGGNVGIKLPQTSGAEKEKINKAIDGLIAGGDTPGEFAIKTAYELAEKGFIPGGINRVILATDGDFNVGQSTDKELETMILKYRQTGIYLSCLGVGMGNYKDSKLETLSKNGNGNFAYIDNLFEGEKVLVTEFSKTLYAVADNASASLHFDSNCIAEYKLIGYDNLKQNIVNGVSELEGGTIGSGHSTLIAYELIKKYSNDSLMGRFSLKYLIPGTQSVMLFQSNIANQYTEFKNLNKQYQFASALIMFAGKLKQTDNWSHYSWDDIIRLTKRCINKDDYTQVEFLKLLQKAKKIYEIKKEEK
ncbi:MAG: von Willebrand factor type A domain-containing protein [Bacteroidetes bacterium]|nr:von Willebrand factor type A domain-containing protein [Bacteroidota bacterium]